MWELKITRSGSRRLHMIWNQNEISSYHVETNGTFCKNLKFQSAILRYGRTHDFKEQAEDSGKKLTRGRILEFGNPFDL